MKKLIFALFVSTVAIRAQLPIDQGGTGSVLTDPGANTLFGWDNTDNLFRPITIGANLSYDHATHTVSASGGGFTPPFATSANTVLFSGTDGEIGMDGDGHFYMQSVNGNTFSFNSGGSIILKGAFIIQDASGNNVYGSPGILYNQFGAEALSHNSATINISEGFGGDIDFIAATGVGDTVQVTATGTAATLTDTMALMDFGTTDPATAALTESAKYLVQATGTLKYNGATYAAPQTVNVELYDVGNATAVHTQTIQLRILTTVTDMAGTFSLVAVVTGSADVMQVRAQLSATPAAGSVQCTGAKIVCTRIK